VRWLGFDWGTHRYHASDYYDRLYEFAEWFIEHDLAYVESSTADEMRALRGTLTEAGTPSRYRQPQRCRESGSLPPNEGGRVSGRRARAAPQDRPREPKHQHARSGDLPIRTRRTTARATSGASIRSTITRTA
jgi:glutamyl/glutaminyl-tRNA synthetase